MKIAVVAIALNEEQFIDRWVESALEADYIVLGDTGSNDKTVEYFEEWQNKDYWIVEGHENPEFILLNINVKPWRFDFARNALLAQVPSDVDYVINLDVDEELQPGWREHMEKLEGSNVTRPRYTYTWSWNVDGSPGLQYQGDKIVSRYGYMWKHPVHEVMVPYGIKEVQGDVGLEIHHHPDNSKPRSQYLPLLEMSVKDDPHDDRNAYYYARELFYAQRYDEAKQEFLRHLNLPSATWPPERAQSMRFIAKCDKEYKDVRIYWLKKAVDEAPGRREALVDLAVAYYENSEWYQCLKAAEAALRIAKKPLDYICEPHAWGGLPYDMAAISCFHLGLKDKAVVYGKLATKADPLNQRLYTNLYFYLNGMETDAV